MQATLSPEQEISLLELPGYCVPLKRRLLKPRLSHCVNRQRRFRGKRRRRHRPSTSAATVKSTNHCRDMPTMTTTITLIFRRPPAAAAAKRRERNRQ